MKAFRQEVEDVSVRLGSVEVKEDSDAESKMIIDCRK